MLEHGLGKETPPFWPFQVENSAWSHLCLDMYASSGRVRAHYIEPNGARNATLVIHSGRGQPQRHLSGAFCSEAEYDGIDQKSSTLKVTLTLIFRARLADLLPRRLGDDRSTSD
jgi:hypothetical protein